MLLRRAPRQTWNADVQSVWESNQAAVLKRRKLLIFQLS
jgi:hypothetical protein